MIIKTGIMTTRYYSIHTQCSLDKLASNIEEYYFGIPNMFDELTVSKMRDIQKKIRTGKYTLSPLQLIVNQKKDPLNEYDHIMHMIIDDSIFYGSFSPILEDQLVLIALGGLLNTIIINKNLLNSSSFGFKVRPTDDYYAHIRSIEGPISRVYKLDMTKSLLRVNKEILLNKLEPILENDEIIQLCKSFLYIPFIYEGMDYSNIINVPSSSFITDVLLNFDLIELDNQFHQLFPSFSYTRYVQEVIVTTSQKESLFESSLFSLFDSLNLDGQILSIGPGDKPMPCYHGGLISITEDGRLLLM